MSSGNPDKRDADQKTQKSQKKPQKKDEVFVMDEQEKDLSDSDDGKDRSMPDASTYKTGLLTEQQAADAAGGGADDLNLSLMETTSSTSSMSGPASMLLDEKESKETFASKLEYILTLVSYAIGFGTMWRFPYLMQQYGGIVFLIPYAFMLAFLGIPIFLLELAVGQRIRKSSIKSWNQISHYLAGIGIASALSCVLIGFYENTLIAWCFFYLINAVQDPLPWSTCEDAEEACHDGGDNSKCDRCNLAGSSSYFWYEDILGISDGIDTPGLMNWPMFGCLIFSWVVIWAILVKGMAVAGKMAYVTSILPYLVMVVFLIRGLLIEGMEYGFKVVFTPDWTALGDAKVWFIAGTQILFTQGLAVGILVSYASLQAPNNNCIKDALTVPLIDFFTSILACVVNCPILGSKGLATFETCKKGAFAAFAAMAGNASSHAGNSSTGNSTLPWTLKNETLQIFNITHFPGNGSSSEPQVICDLLESVKLSATGTGLVFITFTTAVQKFPVPQLWAVLFFIMLLTVGVGSSFPQIEGFVLCLQDVNFFHIGKIPKWKITTVVCTILMICSTVFALGWGQYVLTFIDEFTANWSLLIISFAECIGIAWVYGLRKFSYDLHLMTGKAPSNYFIQFNMICLKFIAPLIMIVLIIFCIVQYGVDEDKLSYLVWNRTKGRADNDRWPTHVAILGFLITLCVVGCIIVFAILAVYKIYPLHEEKRAKFPERRLRRDRDISPREYAVDWDPEWKPLTTWEKILFWKLGDLKKKPSPLVVEAPVGVAGAPAAPETTTSAGAGSADKIDDTHK